MYIKPVLIVLGFSVVLVFAVYLYCIHLFNFGDTLIANDKLSKGIVTPTTDQSEPTTDQSEIEPSTVVESSTDSVSSSSSSSSVKDVSVDDTITTISETSQPSLNTSETVSNETDHLSQLKKEMNVTSKALVDSFQYRPKREDFDNRRDYFDALVAYHESTQPLLDASLKSSMTFFKALPFSEFLKGMAEARELTLKEFPEDVEDFDIAESELLKQVSE